jgi:hypothetical protein
VLLVDGVVSCLRTYQPEELKELVGKLNAADHRRETGTFRDSYFKPPITYLIGYRCKLSLAAESDQRVPLF